MNGLLVVGGVVLGSMATQKAIVGAMHGKEIAKRQNWRECQEVLFENRKSADDVLDNLRWVISKYGHATLAGVRALYENCKFGWTSLRGAKIVCTRNGYTIELPRATPLK